MGRGFLRSSIGGQLGRSAGDDKLVQLAFSQFHDGLYRYLLRKLRNTERAEDLTQEVYLRLLRAAERGMVKNPQAYLFGIAFNVLNDFKLDEMQNPVSFDSEMAVQIGEALPDEADAPEDLLQQREMERKLDRVMATLSPMQQAVLLMAKRQGRSHAEIAATLGIAIGTVRKHLARAMSQCRKAMEQ